jgi:putative spermidine/putrescine transport system ATP-binding protein
MEPAVCFEDVCRYYGEIHALDHVSFTVADGEFFSMLGPSGSGKTTSLRLIAGFEKATAGRIFIHGQPSSGVPPYERNVNTVFQDYALFPHMNIQNNVAYGLKVKGVDRKIYTRRAEEMLALVKLEGMSDRHPAQLSGGQRQRVALARALINEPRVLLLDEPLGALDLKLRKQMQVELKALQRQLGITFIYVTHDQDEALSMSDRLAVFRDGQIEQLDTPAAIYQTPASRFVADFVGNANVIGRTLARKIGGVDRACAIRPEKIFFVAGDDPTPEDVITLRGTVVDSHYHGASTRFTMEVADGQQLILIQPNDESAMAAAPAPGEQRVIAWRRQDMHYFKA